jgi:hypothetical protein
MDGESQALWTLAIDRENDALRYRMMSHGTIGWECVHPLSPLADEFNARLREDVLNWLKQPSRDFLNRLKSLGNVLYSLMIPADMRDRMPPAGAALMISTREQNFHYELIHDGQQFWGCKYSMGRQLVGYQPKRASAFRAQQALKCLMIANPSDDLPQAEEEAVRLMQYLELSGAECMYMASRQVTSAEIMLQLNADRYNLLHYSGHIGREAQGDCAFILADGQHFKLKDVTSLVGFGNPFVFLNGCGDLLSDVQGAQGLMYEGFVAPFIYAGACAVVGTRWAVDDASARRFAECFYGRVLAGDSIGAAMQFARAAACEDGDAGAWPAFMLFGNPDLKLLSSAARQPSDSEKPASAPPPGGAKADPTPPIPAPRRPAAAFLPNGKVHFDAMSVSLRDSLQFGYELTGGISLLSTTHWFVGFLIRGGAEAEKLFSRMEFDHHIESGIALAVALFGDIHPLTDDLADADGAILSKNLQTALRMAASAQDGSRPVTCFDVLTAMMDMNCSMNGFLEPLEMDEAKLCEALSGISAD